MFNKMYINKQNLINNLMRIKADNPNTLVCAMVKANAYGVGLKQVVKSISGLVNFFGVVCFFEAKKVKKYCTNKILIVGALERGNIDPAFSYTCNSVKDVKYLTKKQQSINIHLKINSGMNRYGFSSLSKFKKALKIISKSKLNLEGLYTHFATADNYADKQMKKFNNFIALCKKMGFNPIIHSDNSAVNLIKNHHLNMVRIGFNLYNNNELGFNSVAEIQTKITQVNIVNKGELVGYNYRFVAPKSMRVAVLPIGYADGFDMHYIGLDLCVDGAMCKVLNICMDCFMLDITNTKLKKGDKIKILDKFNSLTKYANFSSTSEYEVMTKFSSLRARRIII